MELMSSIFSPFSKTILQYQKDKFFLVHLLEKAKTHRSNIQIANVCDHT
jgi:hypothetical protein